MKKILIFVFLCIVCLSEFAFAKENIKFWNEYDQMWVKRNVSFRVEILKRAIKHYILADKLFKQGDLNQAEVAAKDALKVVPKFPEVYKLLAMIYEQNGDKKKYDIIMNKAVVNNDNALSPIVEYKYLVENLQSLRDNYSPSLLFNKIIIFLGGMIVIALIVFLLIITNALTYIKMFFIGFFKRKKVGKNSEGKAINKIIIKKFPGDDD